MFKKSNIEYKNCKTKWKETYLEFLCAIDIPENDKVESANYERHYFSYFNVDSFFTKIYGL